MLFTSMNLLLHFSHCPPALFPLFFQAITKTAMVRSKVRTSRTMMDDSEATRADEVGSEEQRGGTENVLVARIIDDWLISKDAVAGLGNKLLDKVTYSEASSQVVAVAHTGLLP